MRRQQRSANSRLGFNQSHYELSYYVTNILPTKTVVKLLTKGKERFGIKSNPINIGNKVDITLFNPDVSYTFTKNDITSKSHNAIFENQKLKGKAYGIIANKRIIL